MERRVIKARDCGTVHSESKSTVDIFGFVPSIQADILVTDTSAKMWPKDWHASAYKPHGLSSALQSKQCNRIQERTPGNRKKAPNDVHFTAWILNHCVDQRWRNEDGFRPINIAVMQYQREIPHPSLPSLEIPPEPHDLINIHHRIITCSWGQFSWDEMVSSTLG